MDREVKVIYFYHKAPRGTWSDEVLSRNRYITSKIPSSDYTFWVEQIHSLLIQSCCSNSWFIRDEWWCIWRACIFFWDILNMIHLPFPFPLYFWCESVNLRTKWRELMLFFFTSVWFSDLDNMEKVSISHDVPALDPMLFGTSLFMSFFPGICLPISGQNAQFWWHCCSFICLFSEFCRPLGVERS